VTRAEFTVIRLEASLDVLGFALKIGAPPHRIKWLLDRSKELLGQLQKAMEGREEEG